MPEQRFQALRNSIKPEEFNSIEFLKQKAQELKESDPTLSERILVRIRNLNNQKEQFLVEEKAELKSRETKVMADKSTTSIVDKVASKMNHLQMAKNWLLQLLVASPFIVLVVLPTLLFALYQTLWASDRFESQAQIIVQQPDTMATMDASMALLSGMGMPTGGSDTEIVKAYIYSNDMVEYLNRELNLREHYSQEQADYFSRMHSTDSREEFFKYYKKHITVNINDKSGVVTIYSQAFDADYAQKLTTKIVKRAEWYINSIGHQLAKAQLTFIEGEHEVIEDRLQNAQAKLLNFQQEYNLLDPTAQGVAMQKIAYTLQGQIAVKQTELKTARLIMSSSAPQVQALKNELQALKAQMKTERNKLAQHVEEDTPVSEILANFTDYKIKMELALQAYTSSQISLEKSRIEAYRQIKYLVVVEHATLSEDSQYPDAFYNISLFLLLSSIIFIIGKIIVSTIQELK